jgi:hypothetical protein
LRRSGRARMRRSCCVGSRASQRARWAKSANGCVFNDAGARRRIGNKSQELLISRHARIRPLAWLHATLLQRQPNLPGANDVSVICDTAWPSPSIGLSAARQADLNWLAGADGQSALVAVTLVAGAVGRGGMARRGRRESTDPSTPGQWERSARQNSRLRGRTAKPWITSVVVDNPEMR